MQWGDLLLELEGKLGKTQTDAEFLDSYMQRFQVIEDGEFAGKFVKAEDKRKHDENRLYLTVNVTMQSLGLEAESNSSFNQDAEAEV